MKASIEVRTYEPENLCKSDEGDGVVYDLAPEFRAHVLQADGSFAPVAAGASRAFVGVHPGVTGTAAGLRASEEFGEDASIVLAQVSDGRAGMLVFKTGG